jgi:hypothetical protein
MILIILETKLPDQLFSLHLDHLRSVYDLSSFVYASLRRGGEVVWKLTETLLGSWLLLPSLSRGCTLVRRDTAKSETSNHPEIFRYHCTARLL